MNRMLIICLLFLLFFITSFANKSIVISERQKELAIFYYEVGQRYKDVGKIRKGKAFQNRALRLYPNLIKEADIGVLKNRVEAELEEKNKLGLIAFENIKLEDISGIVHDKIEINDITNAPKINYIALKERKKNQDKAIKFQFTKFLRALVLKNNTFLLDSVLNEKIEVNGEDYDKKDFVKSIEKSLSKIDSKDVEYLSINDFYDLNSLDIQKDNESSYNVKVSAKVNDITKNFEFWNSNQTLGFIKKGDIWLLFSIK